MKRGVGGSGGMPPAARAARDQLARAREPFFTTKAPGTGLGLGLFLADRFAEHLGGSLSLTAREGGGTRVALELPV